MQKKRRTNAVKACYQILGHLKGTSKEDMTIPECYIADALIGYGFAYWMTDRDGNKYIRAIKPRKS